MVSLVCNEIVKEMKTCAKKNQTITRLEGKVTFDRLRTFNWGFALSEASEKMPVTMQFLDSALPHLDKMKGRKKFNRYLNNYRNYCCKYMFNVYNNFKLYYLHFNISYSNFTCEMAAQLKQCRTGHILSILLSTWSPAIYKFIPEMVGVECWRQGTGQKLMELLHDMGTVCTSSVARQRIDDIAVHNTCELQKWKTEIEVCSCNLIIVHYYCKN